MKTEKFINVRLPEELHYKLKERALRQRKKLQDVIWDLLFDALIDDVMEESKESLKRLSKS